MIKALLLLSFSLFGNLDTEGQMLSGYMNGVISYATDGIGIEEIYFEQLKLFYVNRDDVSFASFWRAMFGQQISPVVKIGVSYSSYGSSKSRTQHSGPQIGIHRVMPHTQRRDSILSFYITGAASTIK